MPRSAESSSSDYEEYLELSSSKISTNRTKIRGHLRSTPQRKNRGAPLEAQRKRRKLSASRRKSARSISREEHESKSSKLRNGRRRRKRIYESESESERERKSESESERSTVSEVSDLVEQFEDSLRLDHGDKGYRLGGTGTNDSLAALARAGKVSGRRRWSSQRINSWRKESEDLLDLHTGAQVEGTPQSKASMEQLKRQYALLLQISPSVGRYAPWINAGVFLRYLQLSHASAEIVWTLPTPQYRLACLQIVTSTEEVARVIRRLRNMSFFHNGLRLRLLVLNHKIVDGCESSIPFMCILNRHRKLFVDGSHHASEAQGFTVEEIARISMPQLVDALGKDVVDIAEAFSCVARRKAPSSNGLTSEAEVYECLRRALKHNFHDQAFRRAVDSIGFTNAGKFSLGDVTRLFAVLKVSNGSNGTLTSSSAPMDYLQECKRVYETYMIEEGDKDIYSCKVPLHDLAAVLQCMGFEHPHQVTSKLDSKAYVYWGELEPFLQERDASM